MRANMKPLILFIFFYIVHLTKLENNFIKRHLINSDWSEPYLSYLPQVESEPLAPLMMKLHRDVISPNGTKGFNGICSYIYRVLYRTDRQPIEDCIPYHNSRQSNFGDITDFYHTVCIDWIG